MAIADTEYIIELERLRDLLHVEGSLSEVISEARRLRSGLDTWEACEDQASALVGGLVAARASWPDWLMQKKPSLLKNRNQVLNAENGDSAREGTNIEYQVLLVCLLYTSPSPRDS